MEGLLYTAVIQYDVAGQRIRMKILMFVLFSFVGHNWKYMFGMEYSLAIF